MLKKSETTAVVSDFCFYRKVVQGARSQAETILNGQAHKFSGYWPSAVLRAMASTTSGLSSR